MHSLVAYTLPAPSSFFTTPPVTRLLLPLTGLPGTTSRVAVLEISVGIMVIVGILRGTSARITTIPYTVPLARYRAETMCDKQTDGQTDRQADGRLWSIFKLLSSSQKKIKPYQYLNQKLYLEKRKEPG